MKNHRKTIIWSALLLLPLLAGCSGTGNSAFFDNQTYNFQVLRVFGQMPWLGGETQEILLTVDRIKDGDDESWFREWNLTAGRVERLARTYTNPRARGLALLRAANYYRSAEFILHPDDERRLPTSRKSVELYHRGMKAAGIPYEEYTIPYGKYTLKGLFYPTRNEKRKEPLIVICGGYDSTLEELYSMVGREANLQGYDVFSYEGPGQGAIIREQGLRFTTEWEKPTSTVLDYFLARKPGYDKIVLVGISLGGYLAPRAAAFDSRIDGVVAFNVCYDFAEAAFKQAPGFMRWLYEKELNGIVNFLLKIAMRFDPGIRWGLRNGMWTMGGESPAEWLKLIQEYNLRDVSSQIKSHVLITAGTEDHFFPVEQVAEFEQALTSAASVTTKIYDRDSGGHEHCQLGAAVLFHADLFDWIESIIE